MKVAILNESKQQLGGGFSFIRNLSNSLDCLVDSPSVADIILIPSPTMTHPDTVEKLKAEGKKIVLRLDNIPRNSRNRGAGTTRMKAIADMADVVIYQSIWAKNYLEPFIKKTGPVIYNGLDTGIFNPTGAAKDFKHGDADKRVYLYSRFNRDETKGWERVWYNFQMITRENPNSKLVIVGQFSDDLRQYNFDFFMGEDVEYLGVVNDPNEMAIIYRGCDTLLAPYFNDCYSNTIQEAMACGLELKVDRSGGTQELLVNGVITNGYMAEKYLEVFNELL